MISIGVRYAFVYGAIFLAAGTFLPYFPVWLESRGFSAEEIGLALALSGFVRFFTMPAIAYVADRARAPLKTLRVITAITVVANIAYLFTGSFWPILTVLMVMTVFGPPILPMTEAMALRVSEKGRMDYGRARLWGSAAFIAANLGIGAFLGSLGPDVVMWTIIIAGVFNVAGYFSLADEGKADPGIAPLNLASAFRLLRSPAFLVFVLAAGAVQATHAVYYSFGTLHWQALGISNSMIGGLWALGVAAEIVLFWKSAPLIKRFGPAMLIGLGAVAALLRWTIMAFDPPMWTLPLLQCLHAFTFGISHLGAMQFLLRAVPPQLASTAQSMYSALASGVLMAGAIFVSGRLYEQAGGLTYLAMTGLAVLACGAAYWGARLWDGERIDG